MAPSLIALAALALTADPTRAPASGPIHLSLVFPARDPAALEALLGRQREPESADYGRFLTPAEFGRRFGQPDGVLQEALEALQAAGFAVEPAPNQTFIGATGSVGQAETLLGIELHTVETTAGRFRVPVESAAGAPRLPPSLRAKLLTIGGLDTRPIARPALHWAPPLLGMGPQDIRRFYGIQPLLDQGMVGRDQQLATLAIAESTLPSAAVIAYFYANVSNASLTYVADVLPNPGNEFADSLGNAEFELDAEAQSLAAPGAAKTVQVIAPGSELYTSGINEIVSNLPQVTAVSISLSTCESSAPGDLQAARTLIQQGVAEGQTWVAASGDLGDTVLCDDVAVVGVGAPASIPEVVAVGGTEAPVVFDDAGASGAYAVESVWSEPAGASGAGASTLFTAPAWQLAVGVGDGGRWVPDLSLIAGGGLAALFSTGAEPGGMSVISGTSVSAPFAAGLFALMADAMGCRFGLVAPTLYTLGSAQTAGGAAVFHDIVAGSTAFPGTPGVPAGPGFDLASGWGSLDVPTLLAHWPACAPAFALPDAGPRVPYDPCPVCDAGSQCVPFFSEGPVWCGALCSASATSNCYQGCGGCDFVDFACQPYDGGGASLCVPSCFSDSDCDYLPGAHCDALGVCTSAQTEDAGAETSPPAKGGCGCGTASASDVALGLGLGLAALVRRRRR